MLTDYIAGAGYLLRGLHLVKQPGLRRFIIIPLLVNILLFAGGLWYFTGLFGEFIDWLLPAWLDWLRWLLWPLFAISLLLIIFYSFTLIANIIAAPFNGLLAEMVEHHLAGTTPTGGSTDWRAVLKGALPTMMDEVRKLLYLVIWAIPFLFLFIVPGLQLIAPITWFFFSAWMLSLEYMDYPASNHDARFLGIRRALRGRRSLALGFGTATLVLTLIPFINFFVMPVAVAGATAAWLGRIGQMDAANPPG